MSVMVLDRFHLLSSGERVRVRMARASDRAALAGLLGLEGSELQMRRMLRRWCLVATVFDGMHETVLGFGAIDEHGPLVLAEDDEVGDLLQRALDEHASAWNTRLAG